MTGIGQKRLHQIQPVRRPLHLNVGRRLGVADGGGFLRRTWRRRDLNHFNLGSGDGRSSKITQVEAAPPKIWQPPDPSLYIE